MAKELTAEGALVMLESLFSNLLLIYFLGKVNWDILLKGAAFVGLQLPIFLLWGIIHIIVKEIFKDV